ncbi:hypothetical protein BD414DRAFT_502501 [Trametes punicea]|nr:hypothetical protein BD414DRAFT_502501 [Trametes punicea]
MSHELSSAGPTCRRFTGWSSTRYLLVAAPGRPRTAPTGMPTSRACTSSKSDSLYRAEWWTRLIREGVCSGRAPRPSRTLVPNPGRTGQAAAASIDGTSPTQLYPLRRLKTCERPRTHGSICARVRRALLCSREPIGRCGDGIRRRSSRRVGRMMHTFIPPPSPASYTTHPPRPGDLACHRWEIDPYHGARGVAQMVHADQPLSTTPPA